MHLKPDMLEKSIWFKSIFFLMNLLGTCLVFGQQNQIDSLGRKQGKWIAIDKKGRILKECFYVNDTLDGEYKRYFPSGDIAESVLYVKGKEEGLFQSFRLKKGKTSPLLEIDYQDGKRNGVYKLYDRDGKLMRYCEYLNESWHGKRIDYLKGMKVFEANFKNGILHGEFIEYHKNGNRSVVIGFYEGKLLTSEQSYTKDGKLYMKKFPSEQRDVFLEQVEYDKEGQEKKVKMINEKPVTHLLFGENVHRTGELSFREEGILK